MEQPRRPARSRGPPRGGRGRLPPGHRDRPRRTPDLGTTSVSCWFFPEAAYRRPSLDPKNLSRITSVSAARAIGSPRGGRGRLPPRHRDRPRGHLALEQPRPPAGISLGPPRGRRRRLPPRHRDRPRGRRALVRPRRPAARSLEPPRGGRGRLPPRHRDRPRGCRSLGTTSASCWKIA